MSKFALGIGVGLTVAGSFLSGTRTVEEKIVGIGKEVKRLNARRLKVNELMRVRQETGGVGEAFQKAAKDAKALGFNIADVERQSKKLERQFRRTKAVYRAYGNLAANKQAFKNLGRQAMAVGGVGLALPAPIKKAANFEQAMARVGAVANSTPEQLKTLSAEARRLGATTSFTASQAAEGMQYLGMAGFKTNQIVAAMPGLLNMAKAGQTDLGRASDIASDMLTAFGMEAAQMPRMADVLTKSFTSSNVTLEMLGDTMKYVAPVAKGVGMSLEETAAMAGLLGNIGIKGSQAGTVMRAMLNRLAAPLGPAQKAFDALHINPLDEDGNLRNVPELLKEVAAATKDMGSGERMGVFKRIFGEEAGAGAAALIEQSGVGALDKFTDILNNSKGAAAELAAKMDDTATGAMLRLGSAVESVALSVGDLFLPVIKFAAEGINQTAAIRDKNVRDLREAQFFGLFHHQIIDFRKLVSRYFNAFSINESLKKQPRNPRCDKKRYHPNQYSKRPQQNKPPPTTALQQFA